MAVGLIEAAGTVAELYATVTDAARDRRGAALQRHASSPSSPSGSYHLHDVVHHLHDVGAG